MAAHAAAAGTPKARHSGEVKTLREARREFLRHQSPWLLGTGIFAALVVRIALGDPSWRDAAIVAGMLVIYPLGEWAIHVYLLHLRPFKVGERKIDLPTAKAHRAHHRKPNDLWMVLLEAREILALLLLAVPLTAALWFLFLGLIAGPIAAGAFVSGLITGYLLVFAYEWCHYLIHTAYRPRSRYYRSIWRNHRLHHFKNEHYWHGITTSISDRILGTFPDQRDVPRSRTARTLDPGVPA